MLQHVSRAHYSVLLSDEVLENGVINMTTVLECSESSLHKSIFIADNNPSTIPLNCIANNPSTD